MRVLPIKEIPKELWFSDKLSIPEKLKTAYVGQLDDLEVLDKAIDGKPENTSIHGGITNEESINHFVYRFPASSGRIEFVTISPNTKLVKVSDAILSSFSSGEISVLDIPGGTGAAMCSLLTTIAVLRNNNILPILPMTVRVLCGDFSPKAIEIYEEMLLRIKPFLNENGIALKYESMIWDATKNNQTAKLVDKWFMASKSHGEYIVCISNFTGALKDANIFDKFTPCLSQILARLDDKKSTVLWIEPSSKSTSKIVTKLLKYFSSAIEWFKKTSLGDGFLSSQYTMINPLNKNEHSSSVEVQRFERSI